MSALAPSFCNWSGHKRAFQGVWRLTGVRPERHYYRRDANGTEKFFSEKQLNTLRSFGNCSMHYSNSCMAQASLSTGARSHLLPAVVRLCGEFVHLWMDSNRENRTQAFYPGKVPRGGAGADDH
jgi:hypothetical protein